MSRCWREQALARDGALPTGKLYAIASTTQDFIDPERRSGIEVAVMIDTPAHGMFSYRKLRWMLAPVAALHNFEEWLTFPTFGDVGGRVASRLNLEVTRLPWEAVQLGLIIVTIAPALIVVWASTGRESRAKDFLVLMVAGIFLANVFAPHIPAAILAGGYSPGVITATAVNLPFCLWLFRAAIRERVLPPRAAIAAGCLGAVLLPFIVTGVLAMSGSLLGATR